MFNKEKFKKDVYEKALKEQNEFYQEDIRIKEKSNYSKIRNIAAIVLVGALIGTGGYATYQSMKKGPDYNYGGASIKFNDEYENYLVEINEKISETPSGSKLVLESVNYDGGFVVFEFDFAITDEDSNYLKLGEKMFTPEELEEEKQSATAYFRSRLNEYNENLEISKEEYIAKYQKKIANIENGYDKSKDIKYGFELQNRNEIEIWANSKQNVEKVSDNEYKVYYYYFIPDEKFDENNKFTIQFNNIRIKQSYDRNSLDLNAFEKDEWIIVGKGSDWDNPKEFNLTGEYSYTVEKMDSLKTIKPDLSGIEYDILTQYIDEIRVTPMQTIIKINSKLTEIKKHTTATTINEWDNPEFIGRLNFNVYDENMNKIEGMKVQAKRDIVFKDGHIESWDENQAGPMYNQQSQIGQDMEVVDYVIISNKDYDGKFYLYPTRDSEEEGGGTLHEAELGKGYIIDFNNIEERQTDEIQTFEFIEVDKTRRDNIDDTIIPITMPK